MNSQAQSQKGGFIAATAGLLAFSILSGSAALAEARPAPASFADLAANVTPAVVNVSVTMAATEAQQPQANHPFNEFFERFFGQQHPHGIRPDRRHEPGRPGAAPQSRGLGSGFIVDADGYIVTNHHVVDSASAIEITLTNGRKLTANVVGSDPRTDLALLKAESSEPLPTVAFGDSDAMRVGDWVMAVGNPFGLGGSVTAGIISADGRNLNQDGLIDFLQIDAPINRGNSGGPLFNSEGEVIGVNTAIFSPNGGNVGIGFAIPSDDAKRIIAELRDHGTVTRGWIGAHVQGLNPELAEGLKLPSTAGALIAEVTPAGPAAKGGLSAGDVVLEWDGEAVDDLNDLLRLVAANPVGEAADVKVFRFGETLDLTVIPQKAPQQMAALGDVPGAPNAGIPALASAGLTVADSPAGVVVAAVTPGSTAEFQGLRQGDVIKKVSGQATATVRSLNQVIAEIVGGDAAAEKTILVLHVHRDQLNRIVPLTIDKA